MRESISYLLGVLGSLSIATWVMTILLALTIGLAMYARYLRKKFNDIWEQKRCSFIYTCKNRGVSIANLLIKLVMLSADKNLALALGKIQQRVDDLTNGLLDEFPQIIERVKANGKIQITDDEYKELFNDVTMAVNVVIESKKVGDLYDFYDLAVDIDNSDKKLRKAVDFLEGRLAELKPKEQSKCVG